MSRSARFVVRWRFDGTSTATVTINRGAATFAVRPFRRRRAYELPLSEVAQLVCERVIKGELLKKRAEKAKQRRSGK